MISTIVHDFRNPMTADQGLREHVRAGASCRAPAQKEYARLIVEEADRMSAMIDEILEFTRGGAARLRISPVSLEALAERIQRAAGAGPGRAPRPLPVRARLQGRRGGGRRAHPARAAQHREQRPRRHGARAAPSRSARRLADGAVELTLDDTGVGIPEELRARIFEPFFTHGKPRGIGLGMSITRRIVEEHGGQVTVSGAPGRRHPLHGRPAPRSPPQRVLNVISPLLSETQGRLPPEAQPVRCFGIASSHSSWAFSRRARVLNALGAFGWEAHRRRASRAFDRPLSREPSS